MYRCVGAVIMTANRDTRSDDAVEYSMLKTEHYNKQKTAKRAFGHAVNARPLQHMTKYASLKKSDKKCIQPDKTCRSKLLPEAPF